MTLRPDGAGGADVRVEPVAELAAAVAPIGGRLWWEGYADDGTVVVAMVVAVTTTAPTTTTATATGRPVSRPGAAGPSGTTPPGT